MSGPVGTGPASDTDPAVEWLLRSDEPAIRWLAARDLLGQTGPSDPTAILAGPKVSALLAGQQDDGGFGGHPYRKWTGAHWRLISLVELAVPVGEPRAVAAYGTVLRWLAGVGYRRSVQIVAGRTRLHASQNGAALAVGCRLGLASDERVGLLAESLLQSQWPDGGWNCDPRPEATISSFHESLIPMWGLHEYAVATGDRTATAAAQRTADLLLGRRLFRSARTGEPVHRSWVALHYPPYWHYDILQALLLLTRVGRGRDPGTADAIEVLCSRRRPDGRWQPTGRWWSPPGADRAPEVVDWGRTGPNEMITLNALRVLAAAGPSE